MTTGQLFAALVLTMTAAAMLVDWGARRVRALQRARRSGEAPGAAQASRDRGQLYDWATDAYWRRAVVVRKVTPTSERDELI